MEQAFNFNKFVLKYGLILGAINLIIGLCGYLGGMGVMLSWWFGISVFLFAIGMLVFVGIKLKKENGGFLTFKEGFIGLITVYAISALIGTLFNMLLFNVIDPELPVQMKEGVMETTIVRMEQWNVPEEAIEKAIVDMEDMDQNYRPVGLLKTYLFMLVFGAVLSLIIAAIVKKKKPEYDFQE